MRLDIQDFGGYSTLDGTVKFYTRVRSLISEKTCVVDWGCGRGADTTDLPSLYRSRLKLFRGHAKKVIGVDIDISASKNPAVDQFYLLSSGRCPEIEAESIDLVVSDFVLEHVDNPDEFFDEISRILKPGGYFCARTTNKWGYVAVAARLIPKKLHNLVLSVLQPDRKPEDVFPAPYRVNTVSAIVKKTNSHFDYAVEYEFAEPAYFGVSKIGILFGRFLHSILPNFLAPSLNVFLRKKYD